MTLTEIPPFGRTENNLQLPDLPEEYLDITIIDNEDWEIEDIKESFPLAISDVTTERILDAKLLTHGDGVKEIYSIELSNSYTSFNPGDTIGILTQNREEDVRKLFTHLGITNLVRKKCRVTEKFTPTKKNLSKPVFIDKITTLEKIFTFYLDIQSIPKKILIRILAEFTKDLKEKRQLEELCSKEKSYVYTKDILEANRTFLELLLSFPTCNPPVARLIENLPKLLPRPYSIASSPLSMPDKIRIVFSVIESKNGVAKEGLCSGMLKRIINNRDGGSVKLFFRKCNGFNLPESDVPLILVGPGTGIAPFIGFLEHRKKQETKGKIWLFYGCRHKTQDYLFEEELQEYIETGVLTKLYVSFSRDGDSVKYVQDNIRKFGKEICDLVLKENAMIYVCGDARNMKKDIQNAFSDIFEKEEGMTNKEAADFIKKLQKGKKYLTDIWL